MTVRQSNRSNRARSVGRADHGVMSSRSPATTQGPMSSTAWSAPQPAQVGRNLVPSAPLVFGARPVVAYPAVHESDSNSLPGLLTPLLGSTFCLERSIILELEDEVRIGGEEAKDRIKVTRKEEMFV
jgi:hypothetical protein